MDESILSDFIEDEGQHLLFVFDYMTDRAFFIKMKEIMPKKTLKDPVCTISMGTPPPQIMDIEEFDIKNDAKNASMLSSSDMDEDFYGSAEYNDDEFDAEGFDEMTFDDKY